MICPSRRHPLSEGLLLYQSHAVCLLSPHGLITLHLIMGIYCRSFFFLLARRDKQAIDESGVMHRLTGTDSTQPTVNMCRQDRISALAVRRCIYLPLTQTHNSTEPQLPRLRGADNTCKRHHSQPLPAHIYSLLFTLSVWTALHWTMFVTSTVEWLSSEWCVSVCGCNVFEHVRLHVSGFSSQYMEN